MSDLFIITEQTKDLINRIYSLARNLVVKIKMSKSQDTRLEEFESISNKYLKLRYDMEIFNSEEKMNTLLKEMVPLYKRLNEETA